MPKPSTIHVACALNDYYLMPYGVMLVSLFENNKRNAFHIHVFSGQLSQKSIEIFGSICKKYHAGFTFYPLNDADFKNFTVNDRIPYVTYYRDMIPQAINPEVNKILYLDGDMIVLGDVSELWNIPIDGYILGAADDLFAIKKKDHLRLGISERYGYFNAGTYLINRVEWVKNNTTQKIFQYSHDMGAKLKYLDQDSENFVMHTKRKVIDQKWNQQVAIYFNYSGFNNPNYSERKLEEVKRKPVIVHFNGIEKPWDYVNLHPFKKEFQYYLKLSGLKKPKEKIGLKKIIKKILYRIVGWSWWNRV